ncbi:hypothetical protein EW026_g822 [Hermanssonia centrifuga]|uniref:BING4 C-terminal domain-containing protein n=1 Tax=Hermanssonia centrifuga TaxID=98765 RepID=A0A4S4KTK5_9APHY|nr:hypothetical protein EW026_g822 [Hermanssonia centrifuga]
MAQNMHNAVIHLGHQNGTVTLWTPNLPHPAVRLLAHFGPVTGLSIDPSTGGRYMATSGQDGVVKVWDCRNWKGAVRQWTSRGGGGELEWSQKGALAVATGGTVNRSVGILEAINPNAVYRSSFTTSIPHTSHTPSTSFIRQVFILVPGAGEPNFDSSEADPFENKKARREKEVKALLDKIQPDMIALDPEFVGSLAPPPKLTTAVDDKTDLTFSRLPRLERLRVQGKADETEEGDEDAVGDDGDENAPKRSKAEKEKKKMRGKNKSLKRYLRKQRKNVIDPKAVAVREKLEKQREERKKAIAVAKGEVKDKQPSALDRFKRPS